jgi:PEP-CTERM/exosortase A-associated glycosyltransferase
MRVLHVLDHSIPTRTGYTIRTLQILRNQRELGWETFHVTGPKHPATSLAAETVDGWSFFRTDTSPPAYAALPGLSELALMKRFAGRIGEVVREVQPDIIHAHSPVLNALPGLRVAARCKIPLVYEVRALWEDAAVSKGKCTETSARYYLSKAMETYALRRADAVVAICEGLRNEIIGRGVPADRVTVVPNGIALGGAREGVPDQALADKLGVSGRPVIGFIGSFEPYEGLSILLAAVADLVAALPDLRVILIGGGVEETALREEAKRLGVTDHVIFAGHVPHGEIQSYYDLIDICVYPRLSMRLTEMVTPLKPVEAMAQGKIVVATNIGGHREMIQDGVTGHLFTPGDPRALARAVRDAFERRNDWPAERAASRRYVDEHRNWRRNVERYKKIYDSLTAASPYQPAMAPIR